MSLKLLLAWAGVWNALIQRGSCVTPKPAIATAKIAERNQFPYHAAISPEITAVPVCSGALVAPKYVLTAASCLHNYRTVHVTLGASNTFHQEEGQLKLWGQPVPYDEYNPDGKHPKYHDIGLVRLSREVRNTQHIRTIALVNKEMEHTPPNLRGVLTGWGHSKDNDGNTYEPNLKFANLHIGDLSVCRNQWPAWTYDTQLCLVGENGTGVPCFGDRGSPFVWGGHVFGVVSVPPSTCSGTQPAYLTHVASYLHWLEERMSEAGPPIAQTQFAARNQFPYHVAISPEITRVPVCSGALIASQFVLTAGFCVYNRTQVHVTLGASNTIRSEQGQLKMWGYAIPYVDYDPNGKHPKFNDIGLVRLPAPTPNNQHIKPIALVTRDMEHTPRGLHGILTGWGHMSEHDGNTYEPSLKFANLHIGDIEACRNQWPAWTYDTQLCLVGENHTGVPCFADRGGPFVSGGYVYGVVSVPPFTCSTTEPSYLTHVASYLHWIEEHMNHTVNGRRVKGDSPVTERAGATRLRPSRGAPQPN